MYFRSFRRFPRLSDPKDFNEKVQARKLRDRNPLLKTCADKVLVKDYVAKKIGDEHVIPTIWSGEKFDPVAALSWPLPFVVKANHTSGDIFFVRSSDEMDIAKLEQMCNAWVARPYQPHLREWAYQHIKPQILVEPFIAQNGKLPLDFKIFVFNGVARYIQVDVDRESNHTRCFYDRDWHKCDFALYYPFYKGHVERPKNLEKMLNFAEILSKEFSFVRCDFYEVDGHIYFGEMTFYPGAGIENFTPREWDRKFGDLWTF